jgi:anti-sigma factor RsiW
MPDARDGLELDLLSAYLDGELDADTRAAVEARLGESLDWREELAAVESARTLLRDLPAREAPASYWDRVIHDVSAADGADDAPAADDETVAPAVPIAAARSARAGRRPNRPGWVVWAAGAAAAVAGVVVVVVLPSRQSVRPNVTAAVTAHGASASHVGDPVGGLAPLGPIAGLRR